MQGLGLEKLSSCSSMSCPRAGAGGGAGASWKGSCCAGESEERTHFSEIRRRGRVGWTCMEILKAIEIYSRANYGGAMEIICSYIGCERPMSNKKTGLCSAHYQQHWRGVALKDLPPPKREYARCPVPGCWKKTESGVMCSTHSSVCWRMSLTRDQYLRLMEENWCYACGSRATSERRVAIDHDHECCSGNWSCGKCIRGTLCSRHNLLLARFEGYQSVSDTSTIITYLNGAPHFEVDDWIPTFAKDSHPTRVSN